MRKPETPVEEAARLASLRSLGLVGTPPEDRFDRFTRLAQRVFQVPIALISAVDSERLWFKSRRGLELTETPREGSFCGQAILGEESFVVPDAARDERFRGHPLVASDPGIRFYAGYPLAAPDGHRVGTLCVLDRVARSFGAYDRLALSDLGQMLQEEIVTRQLATQDPLTGLANRRGFERTIEKVMAVCDRSQTPVSLIYFDLDGFKQINDFHGHKEGDRALIEFADLLLGVFRSSDVVARMGGDEFCVLLTGTAEKDLRVAVERFALEVARHNAAPGRRYDLACSAGVFTRDPARHRSVAQLLEEADRRMYEQKRRRKRQAGYSSE